MTKEAYKNRRRTKKEAEHINEFAIFQVSYDFNEIAWKFLWRSNWQQICCNNALSSELDRVFVQFYEYIRDRSVKNVVINLTSRSHFNKLL